MIDEATCWDAMNRRDPSFDGLFFVAVKTTGIYCRPVCTARMPRRENVGPQWDPQIIDAYFRVRVKIRKVWSAHRPTNLASLSTKLAFSHIRLAASDK